MKSYIRYSLTGILLLSLSGCAEPKKTEPDLSKYLSYEPNYQIMEMDQPSEYYYKITGGEDALAEGTTAGQAPRITNLGYSVLKLELSDETSGSAVQYFSTETGTSSRTFSVSGLYADYMDEEGHALIAYFDVSQEHDDETVLIVQSVFDDTVRKEIRRQFLSSRNPASRLVFLNDHDIYVAYSIPVGTAAAAHSEAAAAQDPVKEIEETITFTNYDLALKPSQFLDADNPIDNYFDNHWDMGSSTLELRVYAVTYAACWEAELRHAYGLLLEKAPFAAPYIQDYITASRDAFLTYTENDAWLQAYAENSNAFEEDLRTASDASVTTGTLLPATASLTRARHCRQQTLYLYDLLQTLNTPPAFIFDPAALERPAP